MSSSSWLDLLQHAALFALVGAALFLVVLTIRNGLVSLGLYMDRSEGEATVEAEWIEEHPLIRPSGTFSPLAGRRERWRVPGHKPAARHAA